MSKNQKMEFKINSSPHLKMSEITKRLFNRNFHSDVQFVVQGKIIYAHSLELIKRSVVFEEQLEDSMGNKTSITINDCTFENYLEFIRYIYTDECTINDDNFIDILKMAAKYKVIKLENQIMNMAKSIKWILKCFEHCVRDKYEIAKNFIEDLSAGNFHLCLDDKQFFSLHPDAVDELLKFERVEKGVTESQIFIALADWILSYCRVREITLSEGRPHFDKLIKKIRFPTLSPEQLRECTTKYPTLLSGDDHMSIGSQMVFGENELWISKGREEFTWPYEYRTFQHNVEHKTICSVSKDTNLYGLRIGVEEKRKPIEIAITEFDGKTEANQTIRFVQNSPHHEGCVTVCLGESIQLKSTLNYTISVKYLGKVGNIEVGNIVCRTESTDVIINDPSKTVKLIEASGNMMEIFFRPATD